MDSHHGMYIWPYLGNYPTDFGKMCNKTVIMLTCPCNEHPLPLHFYIVKLGFTGVFISFLFLLQNIDCGYSLEPPRRGGSDVFPQSLV